MKRARRALQVGLGLLCCALAVAAIAAGGLTWYGEGSLSTGARAAIESLALRYYFAYRAPLFRFWGEPAVWVEANGGLGLAANGMYLSLMDLRSATPLAPIAELEIGGIIHDLEVDGDVIYLAAGKAGLIAVDTSDARHPEPCAKRLSTGYPFGVHLDRQRHTLLLAEREGGVRLFDVSKRCEPRAVGSPAQTEWANDVDGRGATAYVADGHEGLVVVDFSDPGAPRRRGTLALPPAPKPRGCPPIDPPPLGIEVVGDVAYLAGGDRGLVVADVRDPDAPRLAATLEVPGETVHVRVVGDRAYLSQEPDGLAVVDISSPAAPRLLSLLPVPGSPHASCPAGPDRLLLALLGQGIALINVADPSAPTILARSAIEPVARAVAWTPSHAFTAEGPGGLGIYSLADPEHPRLVARVPVSDNAYDVQVDGTLAYLAAGQAGLVTLDVSNPGTPEVLSIARTPEHAFAVSVAPPFAYTAEGMYQYAGVDLSDPRHATVTRVGPQSGYGMGVLAVDGSLLVANYFEGLKLFDLSSPGAAPERFRGPRRVTDLARSGSLVHLAVFDTGLEELDVSEPTRPLVRGKVRIPGWHFGIDARDSLVAVAAYDRGLWLVDTTDPGAPRRLGHARTVGQAYGVALGERYAYVADGTAGLSVIEITDPSHPRLVE